MPKDLEPSPRPTPGTCVDPLDATAVADLVAAVGDVLWSFAPVDDRVVYLHPAEAGPGRPAALRTAEAAGWRDAVHPDDRERFAAALQSVYTSGAAELMYRRIGPDGEQRWLHDRMHRSDDQGAPRIIGYARDVTACKLVEAEAEQMHAIVATVSEGIAVSDERGRCLVYNPQMEAITGYTRADTEGPGLFTRLFPERGLRARAVAHLLRARRGHDLVNQEWRIVHSDGHARDLLVSTRLLGGARHLLMAIRDVTGLRRAEEERRAVERRLREAERLDSLGVMAGGIAHDFNNLLQSILGFTDLAVSGLAEGSSAASALAQVHSAGQRAAELTRQMLAYAGRTRFVPRLCDLTQVARRARPLLAASLAASQRLELELPEALPAVDADPSQLRQVLINLVANASEALSEQGGRVVVRAGALRCERAYLASCYPDDGQPEGEYAYLEVEDDGCGMTELTRARLFDPFYSTKFTGRGLGLAAVLGIVRGHRGTLHVRSAPKLGTTIRVLLPTART
jgi:two-component system, cell cycle sensor histidine kinase and response regulator CckA